MGIFHLFGSSSVPEIPVNIVYLGLVYDCQLQKSTRLGPTVELEHDQRSRANEARHGLISALRSPSPIAERVD